MRILLDECLPRRLKFDLVGHEVDTVPEAGWAGKSNGELLRLAARAYDAFVTVDRKLPVKTRPDAAGLVVVLLVVGSNRYESLRPFVPRLLQVLATAKPGSVIHVEA